MAVRERRAVSDAQLVLTASCNLTRVAHLNLWRTLVQADASAHADLGVAIEAFGGYAPVAPVLAPYYGCEGLIRIRSAHVQEGRFASDTRKV